MMGFRGPQPSYDSVEGAKQIAELARQGRKKEEAAALMEEFERVREEFFKALDELYLG